MYCSCFYFDKNIFNNICFIELLFHLPFSTILLVILSISILTKSNLPLKVSLNYLVKYILELLILSTLLIIFGLLLVDKYYSNKCASVVYLIHFGVDIILWIVIVIHDYVIQKFRNPEYFKILLGFLYIYAAMTYAFTYMFFGDSLQCLFYLSLFINISQTFHLLSYIQMVRIGELFKNAAYKRVRFGYNFLFGKIWSLIINGVQGNLSLIEFLLPLTDELSPELSNLSFNNFNSFKSIIYFFRKKIVFISFIKLLCLSTSLIYPIILMFFVKYLMRSDSGFLWGTVFVLGFFINSIISGFSSVYYNYFNSKLGYNLKSKLVPALLKEIMGIPFLKQTFIHHGQLLDYLTADVDRIVNFFPSIQEFWSMPLQIVISTVLLFQQVGISTFGGIGFIIILIPLNKVLANKISQYSSSFMHNKDERIKVFTDFLRSIIGVKVSCYENIFYQEISNKRKKELKYLKRQKYLDAFCVIFWAICPVVICALTFTIYVFLGNTIDTIKVLTCLALFNLLIGPMNALPWVINGVVEAMVSLNRINSINKTSVSPFINTICYDTSSTTNTLIKISAVDFTWTPIADTVDLDQGPLFRNVNFDIKENEYIGVVGNVGSGKTSFLFALMQEMNQKVNGSYELSDLLRDNSIAFVSQKPWLLKKSIRENIILFEKYDWKWYQTVIEACGLDIDFSLMQNGDQTQISDHGSSLSGGQKSRICLARAIYHRTKLYLLDDPLSSLDFHVANLIIENVLSRLLINATVVLTTHNAQFFVKFKDFIRVPDKIFQISNGNITQTDAKLVDLDSSVNCGIPVNPNSAIDVEEAKTEEILSVVNKEFMEHGTINFNIYLGYVKLIGYLITAVILFSLLLMQGTKNFSEYWLSKWTSSSNSTGQNHSQSMSVIILPTYPIVLMRNPSLNSVTFDGLFYYFLKIYLSIVLLNFLFSIVRAFSFAYGGIKASYECHNKLLSVLMRAKLNFFENTSRGQILNRFTLDLSTIDDNLPFVVNIFLANLFACIGSLVVVGASLPFVIFIILPIIYFCYYFQFLYRMTSRSIKRLISINRSPLFSHFSEMIEGMIMIRYFRNLQQFIYENNAFLSNLIRCEYSGLVLSCWLALRLQIIGIIFVTAVVMVSIIVNYFQFIDKSLIGLACVYSFSVSSLLSNVITYATESEKEFIAVERCFEYIFPKFDDKRLVSEYDECHSESLTIDNTKHFSSMILKGSVEFQHVYLRYTPNESYALQDINAKIYSGQTVGIIGRTGSGKSSLIKLLFRLSTFEPELINKEILTGFVGKILIDGTDICDFDLRHLRLNLASMMQESLIFSGTIRQNLDPMCNYSDEELVDVSVKLQFNTYFSEFYIDGRLNINGYIDNQGRELSYGQHQLLCLGRIMLSRNKIVCLDEPSAYLDQITESIIEKIILSEFSNKTVFIVGHRLPMLVRICDSIMVMDQGRLIEYGSVSDLLANKHSYLFASMKNNF